MQAQFGIERSERPSQQGRLGLLTMKKVGLGLPTTQAPSREDRHVTLPTSIDRYPAKMVASLAKKLVSRYTAACTDLLDPFCGSSAILAAGQQRGIPVAGIDINPYAVLLSKVK